LRFTKHVSSTFVGIKEQYADDDTFISEDDWLALGVTHLRLDKSRPNFCVDFRLRPWSLQLAISPLAAELML
jgi:hypothetical protein